jgi:hypothetical protein
VRNKLRVIDVSILSSYMGRALTFFVTLFVVGIAVSALIDGGGFEKNVINVCVPAGARPGDAVESFEPLRSLLGRESRRPVVLLECAGEWPPGQDIYVMPVDEFFRWERELQVAAIYDVSSSETRNDKAVFVVRQSAATFDLSSVAPDDVVFVHPSSVNGFWVQAEALAWGDTIHVPEAATGAGAGVRGAFRFVGSPRDATRVICGVATGAFDIGACKLSDLSELSRRGVIGARELRVIGARDALPETVIAVKPGERRYFEAKIRKIAALLDGGPSAADQKESIRLLETAGVRRLDPIDAKGLEGVRRLFVKFEGLTRSSAEAGGAGRAAPESGRSFSPAGQS